MGSYTILENPSVDETIEKHLQRIVGSVVSRMTPQAIVLRGSFGRGEGSLMVRGKELYFLSDYEIDVTTTSPLYRPLFAELSRSLSMELGVQTGIRWARPDCLSRDRIGPFPIGKASTTISLYEFRYGSQILFGQDFLSNGPQIDPAQIRFQSGLQLLLNRMAESLTYMSLNDDYKDDSYITYYWINKTVLACSESLLLFWKQYHYSYQERGRRFADLAPARLMFMHDQGAFLSELVSRATEFKLRPAANMYQGTVRQTWEQFLPACDAVFRHLVNQGMGIPFGSYSEFPDLFLKRSSEQSGSWFKARFFLRKMLEMYRAVNAPGSLRSLLSKFYASQIVYSVVPLLFFSYCGENRAAMLNEARRMLEKLGHLQAQQHDLSSEWDYLRKQLVFFWKTYCY